MHLLQKGRARRCPSYTECRELAEFAELNFFKDPTITVGQVLKAAKKRLHAAPVPKTGYPAEQRDIVKKILKKY